MGLAEAEGVLVLNPGDRNVAHRLAVIEQIRLGCLPVVNIVSAPTPVTDALAAYTRLRDNPSQFNAVAFKWI